MHPPHPTPPSAPPYPEITGCVAALGDCVVLQQTCSGIFCHQLLSFRNTNCVVGHERNGDTFKMPSKVVFVFFYNVFECRHLLAAPACDSELFRNRPTLQLSLPTAV